MECPDNCSVLEFGTFETFSPSMSTTWGECHCQFNKISKIRNSPFYRGVDLWNGLNVEHHRAENKKRFKYLSNTNSD